MEKKTFLLVFVLIAGAVALFIFRDSLKLKEYLKFSYDSTATDSAELASPSGQFSTKKGFGKILGETSMQ